MQELEFYSFDGRKKFSILDFPTDSGSSKSQKKELIAKTDENLAKITQLQSMLFAENKESLLIVLQALDAAGKDSTIRKVLNSVDPQGIDVHNFRTPNIEEASHDFLWRYHKRLPAKGKIGIFNRSYYEEVLVVKVHKDYENYNVPARVLKGDYIKKKYKDIKDWEKYLYTNGIKIVKIFLDVSKEMQKNRFMERIDRPEKHWKFSANDIKERAYFADYQTAFEDAINATSTKDCPWYVIPADQKWYTRFLVSSIILQALQEINPHYPDLPKIHADKMDECKAMLNAD